jgi:hypothetical protein
MLSMEEKQILARLLLQEEAEVPEEPAKQERTRDELGRYAKESKRQADWYSRSIKLRKIRGTYKSYDVVDDVDYDLAIIGGIILLFAIIL